VSRREGRDREGVVRFSSNPPSSHEEQAAAARPPSPRQPEPHARPRRTSEGTRQPPPTPFHAMRFISFLLLVSIPSFYPKDTLPAQCQVSVSYPSAMVPFHAAHNG